MMIIRMFNEVEGDEGFDEEEKEKNLEWLKAVKGDDLCYSYLDFCNDHDMVQQCSGKYLERFKGVELEGVV